MKKHVEYQVCYEVVSTLEYLKEEEPGEHYFSLRRTWTEGLWDSDEDEVLAYVKGGVVVGVEGYSGSIHPEEEIVVREMMAKILAQ
jgi:hypothetical protein